MRQLFLSFLFATAVLLLQGQTPIVYRLDLAAIQHHELGVQVAFPGLPPQPLVVRMPTSSPGRYAIHNFAKNVYNVQAYNAQGQALPVSRTGLNEWTVANHGGHVFFNYTLFANRADGTYAKVDNRKLHLNMPATFVYAVGLSQRPVELIIPANQQPDWQVATQLQRLGDRHFRAPNTYYFYDSPTFVGDIRFRRWTVSSGARVDTIEMAFLTPDPDSLLDAYAAWTKKVVATEQAVYGELPAYDYGRYTFLCAYNPYVNGDGMEHRNSTVCSASVPLKGFQNRLIGTIAHEFFHCWNVERIRPAALEPFDFDQANVSGELWFAEGFTSYYDDLSLARAGILSPADYAEGLTGSLNYVLLHPGSQYRSPIEMSQCAPFVDAATSIDGDNFANTYVSYYPYGAVLGLSLDLTLRRDQGTTLDAFMQLVWQRHGQREIPYNIPDLEHALADLTDNPAFANNWFAQHIYQGGLPDVLGQLAEFGIAYEPIQSDTAGFLGLETRPTDDGLQVTGTVFVNNPLYQAGVASGDLLLTLNNLPIFSAADWQAAAATLVPGKTYPVTYRQNGVEEQGEFIATLDPSFRVLLAEKPTSKIRKRLEAWLQQ